MPRRGARDPARTRILHEPGGSPPATRSGAASVLGPKILGKHVGLHPVLLILSLLLFGYFMGFLGLLIAVPVTALLIAGVKEWETARKRTLAGE